jgi:hypothetical protein
LEVDVNLVTESVSPTYPTTLTFPENYFEAYEAAWRQIPDVLTYGEDRSVAANMIDTRFADYANAHAS